MSKKILAIIILLILTLGLSLFLYSPVIFQEGNPWPQIKGIVQLNFSGKKMVNLIGEDKFMTKSKKGPEIIKNFMKEKGYEFTDQMGSGYLFKSPTGESALAEHRHYSRYYSLWKITENTQTANDLDTTSDQFPSAEISIADELKECLPKSDKASHERCGELLASIRNYDDCINAGFSIMKSNPPQCVTPDGRTFSDETNSTWDIALKSLNNCEVESVFQTHSKLVTLKLENGSQMIVYEPLIDEVMKVVDKLNGKCGNIILATE